MRPDLLMVDDQDDQILMARHVLKMVDPTLKMVSAESGKEALNILRSSRSDLPKMILLDLRMPGMSGQELLTEIKSDPVLKDIPICIFSSSNLEDEICDTYRRGACCFFTKPTGLSGLKDFFNVLSAHWFRLASHCNS